MCKVEELEKEKLHLIGTIQGLKGELKENSQPTGDAKRTNESDEDPLE